VTLPSGCGIIGNPFPLFYVQNDVDNVDFTTPAGSYALCSSGSLPVQYGAGSGGTTPTMEIQIVIEPV
jgi:hypothetical protein